ncbi:hypothetical protein C8R46DRAFT_1038205 [Mycena filopes]|nr:hypothetical protein C8R46DRAFT_1038205 [Mycena filopes]
MPLSLAPALASFIVLAIDPVATVSSLNDPIATAAAQKMVPQKYVGYVSKASATRYQRLSTPRSSIHTYAIQLTSPTASANCGLGDCSIGISPSPPHPDPACAPLRLRQGKALPWTACQPSSMRSVVRVPVRLEDDAGAVFLEPADAMRHRRILANDEAEEGRRRQSGSSTPSSSTSSIGSLSTAPGGYVDPGEYTGDFTHGDDERYYAETVRASTAPVVHVSYDLAQLDTLPDPLAFFEEKRRLKQLEVESLARSVEARIRAESPSEEEEEDNFDDPPALWPWEYGDLRSNLRVVSVLREISAKTRHLAIFLGHLKELLQSWRLI